MNDLAFSRMLLVVEPGDAWQSALRVLAPIAAHGHSHVSVMAVVDRTAMPSIVQDRGRDAEHALATCVASLRSLGIESDGEVGMAGHNDLPTMIAAATQRTAADLVVLVGSGDADTAGLLAGSSGQQIISRLECPVLQVRSDHPISDRSSIQRILLAVAGYRDIGHATRVAATLARLENARVMVVHVRLAPSGRGGAPVLESVGEARQLVDDVVEDLRAEGIEAHAWVRPPIGPVAQQIADSAADFDSDVIVIGSRRLTNESGFLVGGTAKKILHLADRPVLVADRPRSAEMEQLVTT